MSRLLKHSLAVNISPDGHTIDQVSWLICELAELPSYVHLESNNNALLQSYLGFKIKKVVGHASHNSPFLHSDPANTPQRVFLMGRRLAKSVS